MKRTGGCYSELVVTLQFMALSSNCWFNSWFGLQIQQSSGVLPWQVLFFWCNCLNWGKSACLSAAVVIFPWNNIQKTITTLYFFANVLIEEFYYNALGAFLKHWYNALIVAQKSCDCWCRLTTSFAVHINVTKIAISTSRWYFDTVKKAQESLCKRADSQEPLLPAQDLLIFVTLSSDCLRKCADSPENSLLAWIAHKSPFKAA